jgi:predicted DNA-binding transcriptional regulator YafY
MRRADRLFQIVQELRGGRLVTARTLAEHLEVSPRTIYRDVRDLLASGVPIQGEAGVGYTLPKSFDLPPLMFDRHEIEALVIGARIVQSWGDGELARAARAALSKVEVVLPERLRHRLDETALFAPGFHVPVEQRETLGLLRKAVAERRRVWLDYKDAEAQRTERVVRPLGLFFWGTGWSLCGWCELRDDFRNFRLDRMHEVQPRRGEAGLFELEPGKTLEDFLRRQH